ncbi:MAG: PHP domain-containing protein [Verrucomicrobia bacterium]|nr:PHP domain-containing protein [Verrucomicrobiota bacterium]
MSLSEWGLFPKDAPNDNRVSLELHSEEELFAALGLAFIPPELREGLDEIEMAERRKLPELISIAQLQGALHNHTNASDGIHSLDEMARAAADLGWKYIGIADHSQASFQANGLSVERLLAQINEIKDGNASGRFPLHVFAGCEVDILKDGSLDFDAEVLNQLDYVVLSVHSPLTGMTEDAMTERICKALSTPLKVQKIWGHPTGRLLLRREPYKVDFKRVFQVACQQNVWIELNATPERLDLDWRILRQARAAGLKIIINPDAHSSAHLSRLQAGVNIARKAGLTSAEVVNCNPFPSARFLC